MRTILASASPRRKELLGMLGIEFEIQPAKGEEIVTKTEPEEIVQELAAQKAMEIALQQKGTVRIIGSDTIVVYKNQIFGKPADEEDAFRMLTCLQGETHQVYTGVCVIDVCDGEQKIKTFAEKTDVTMYPVSEAELKDYIATKEPMDKAGAYAVQGLSSRFIKGLCGDYFNVVGLPIARLYQECYK